jgi:hypothetical protein
MTPLIIHNKDVQKIFSCAPATATKKIDLLKSALKKKRHQVVTIKELCSHFDIPLKDAIDTLKSA